MRTRVKASKTVLEECAEILYPRRGRKPISPNGQTMAPRKIRMTDSDWEDAKLIGMEAIRKWIRKTAAKQRST
jgi:hypothetical protein